MHQYITVTDDSPDIHWFPMRVTYGRGSQVAEALSREGVEYFLPVEEKAVFSGDGIRIEEKPLVSNLIFVHSTKAELRRLKSGDSICSALGFMMYSPHSSEEIRIIIISDEEMEKFMKVVAAFRGNIEFLPFSESFRHIGRRIRIISGPLAGIEGVLRRIKNNRHVHIDCGGLLVAQLSYTPKEMYQLIPE